MTAVGEAGEGRRGSAPPRALLLLPPLTLCGGIVGQLESNNHKLKSRMNLDENVGGNSTHLVLVCQFKFNSVNLASNKIKS